MAFALVKEMQADGLEWGEDCRPLGRLALRGASSSLMTASQSGCTCPLSRSHGE